MEPASEKKKDNTALYIVYAAAAYFGLQFLLKPKRTEGAAIITYPVNDPAAQAAALPSPIPDSPGASTVKTTWIAESFPLRKGMKGGKTKALQQKLGLTPDGAFGNNTEAALLTKYGVSIVSQALYSSIISPQAKVVTNTAPVATVATWMAESFPLRKGMKGANIKALQQKLGVAADGAFGAGTEAAVISRFGTPSVSEVQFRSLNKTTVATFSTLLENMIPRQPAANDYSAILQSGSRGGDVYRLQKWLGFKDKKSAKKGEFVADSIFGKQTLAALQKKTGKASITVSQLNALTKQLAGLGYLGEVLVTKRATTILDSSLTPHRNVPGNTILGTRTMELSDPQAQKAYTQFKTVDGFHRWVETDAV